MRFSVLRTMKGILVRNTKNLMLVSHHPGQTTVNIYRGLD